VSWITGVSYVLDAPALGSVASAREFSPSAGRGGSQAEDAAERRERSIGFTGLTVCEREAPK